MAIKWKWDGKTVTLVNDEPVTYTGYQGAAEQPGRVQQILESTGRAMPDQERMDLMGAPAQEGPPARRPRAEEALKASREQKNEWRKQLNAYYKGMKDVERGKTSSFDAAAGMQELLDAGAAWEEEDGGLGTPIAGGGKARRDAMVRAHDAYVDFMHEHGNTAFDPDLGWYNPDIGLPMVPDSSGRPIVKRPDGWWMPAFGTGIINQND